MKRVALYVRVSTAEQRDHGLSVDSQIEALKAFCEENGYFIQGIYNDAGISARKSYKKRPALLQLMEDCRSGAIDLIIFTKLDRWFRSVGDYYEVQNVLDQHHVAWRAIWEDYETETSSGVFKVNIMLSVAQSEADRTSERIKAVKDYQRALGNYVGGVAPWGYKVKKHDLLIDEDQRDLVSKVFETYLLTYSMNAVLEMLRAHGSSRSRNGVYNMLINPTYAGDANGYKCEAYITPEQFAQIKTHLGTSTRFHKDSTKNVYLFNGLCVCGTCGGAMTGTIASKYKDGQRIITKYYRCTNWQNRKCERANNLSEKKIEKRLIENLDAKFQEYLINYDQMNVDLAEVESKISALEAKLSRIGDRYEDGDITREEYRSKRYDIKKEIDQLQAMRAPEIKSIPNDWRIIYKDLDDQRKKIFWNHLIEKIVITKESFDFTI